MKSTKHVLGRGLGALMESAAEARPSDENSKSGVVMVDIRRVEPNPGQPRQFFDEGALKELAESMKEFGIVQPLLVKDEGSHYSIIAGERRYRAARMAKINEIPVLVKDYTEMETLQVALIENLQRQDLTAIEEAVCFKRLMDDFLFSAEEVAENLGKNKHAVISSLHILELAPEARQLAAEGKLTASHAKALLAVEDDEAQVACARKVAESGLSVRETEAMISSFLKKSAKKSMDEGARYDDIREAYRQAEDSLKAALGRKVQIIPGKKRSKIEIEYYDSEDLENLLQVLGKAGNS